jgi:hypothetical protein
MERTTEEQRRARKIVSPNTRERERKADHKEGRKKKTEERAGHVDESRRR